ncbi:MAG: TonB-dependent receptor [Pseudomonadales bacterium]
MTSYIAPVLCGLTLINSAMPVAARESVDANHREVEEIVVVAHPLSGEGLAQATVVLTGEALERKLGNSVGATLAQEPGINSAQFGHAVGRPVIHGLGGPRVRIMEDRIDALDVSVTSADHAVTIEPFIAERREVRRGSSTLLYGSGAIGGVVDVHTSRIPHDIPEQQLSGGIESRFDDNTNGNATAVKLNGGWGKFAWHLDGTHKDGDDYEIPGFAESDRLRALEAADGDAEEPVRDVLPGSAFDSKSYAAGGAYVGSWGFVGASVGEIEADYGLPGAHAEEADAAEAGTPTLDMEQTRFDFELGVKNPFGEFTSLNVRLGVNDYEHEEIEASGDVATRFTNEAWELRAELVYEQQYWSGVFGLQHMARDFSASGEEAFVPPVDTEDSGLFWVAEREFERFSLEAGLRLGRVAHKPQSGSSENFTTYAASAGIVLPIGERWDLGLLVDYAARAPIGEELYSNGPHLVTGSFELGDPTLDSERAANLSTTLSFTGDVWQGQATVYYTQFIDFIYEQSTGEMQDGLPVFQFQQDDAEFFGLDAELTLRAASWESGDLEVRAMIDLVEARLDVRGNDNLPRIPPMRYGFGLLGQFGRFTASIDYLRVTEQDDVTEQTLTSSAYNDLRAYVAAEFALGQRRLSLFLSGKNLTDDEQRNHTSFIKEFAPAPGRTLEAGVRVVF